MIIYIPNVTPSWYYNLVADVRGKDGYVRLRDLRNKVNSYNGTLHIAPGKGCVEFSNDGDATLFLLKYS